MRSPNLRTRLLTATAAIVLLTIAAAFAVVAQMRAQLIEQIDNRLTLVASTSLDGPGNRSDERGPSDRDDDDNDDNDGNRLTRPADVYEGALSATNQLETTFLAAPDGIEFQPPTIDLETARSSRGEPITIESADGDVRYRAIATVTDSDDYVITGLTLDGVDATMSRLVRLLSLSVAAIFFGLGAATWWVIRLGITPLHKMTRTAETISAGDLSERIANVDEGTEAGQLGRAFNTMLGRIETSFDERLRAEERLRQFLADASHELRTPVATIRGYAELYRTGALSEQVDLDDAMRRTEQESLRMSRLINEMLELAELDRSPTLATNTVDLAAVVRDAVNDATARAPDRDIVGDAPEQPLTLSCDGDLVRQIVTNLVGNALVHTTSPASVSVATWSDGETAHLTVADNGEGMAEEAVRRATERFYRADPARSRSKGGSGLGLSIVDAAVTAHGGKLTITSGLGTGTSVHVQLPLSAPSNDAY